jgi:hypothetical protein
MSKKLIINSYKRKSRSARRLAKALSCRIYKPGDEVLPGTVVINWGDSQCPLTPCLNQPQAVSRISHKRRAFELFAAKDVPIPRFALSPSSVTWDGTTVVRHKLQGHSGEGIELISKKEELPDAPLYVEYIKKEQEYRIHVGRSHNGYDIIAEQRKARRLEVPSEQVDWQVRNHSNGFVFVRQSCSPPAGVRDAATRALNASGLDFGAVDVIYNEHERKAYVLEINCAPGLEGKTIADYADFFNRF